MLKKDNLFRLNLIHGRLSTTTEAHLSQVNSEKNGDNGHQQAEDRAHPITWCVNGPVDAKGKVEHREDSISEAHAKVLLPGTKEAHKLNEHGENEGYHCKNEYSFLIRFEKNEK